MFLVVFLVSANKRCGVDIFSLNPIIKGIIKAPQRAFKKAKMFDKVINFIKETRVEMSRVTWPTQNIIVRDTILVVIVSLGLAIFLGALDKVFTFLVTTFLL